MTDERQPAGPPPLPPASVMGLKEDNLIVRMHRGLRAGFGAFLQIAIREKGDESGLLITANLSPRQEIGFYRTILPAIEVDRIRTLLRTSNYKAHAHRGRLKPDMPTTTLSEEETFTFTHESPPPASVKKVFDALDEAAGEISKHPYFVLRGHAQWATLEVGRSDHAEVMVVLSNVGTQDIIIDNPLGSKRDNWVGLRLKVSRDKPQAQLDWEKDVNVIDLVPGDLLTAEGRRPKDQPPRIELASGEEFRFLARRKLLRAAGSYTGSLTFTGGTDDKNPKRIGGFLTMDLGKVAVTP